MNRILAMSRSVRLASAEPDLCCSFHVVGDADRWIQYGDALINARYPRFDPPARCLHELGGELVDWEPGRFITVCLGNKASANAIGWWMHRYFREVLASDYDYTLVTRLAPMRRPPSARRNPLYVDLMDRLMRSAGNDGDARRRPGRRKPSADPRRPKKT